MSKLKYLLPVEVTSMVVDVTGFILEFVFGISKIILRADNSCQYQLSSQTGARSARHSVRPTIHKESCLKDSHFVALSGQWAIYIDR